MFIACIISYFLKCFAPMTNSMKHTKINKSMSPWGIWYTLKDFRTNIEFGSSSSNTCWCILCYHAIQSLYCMTPFWFTIVYILLSKLANSTYAALVYCLKKCRFRIWQNQSSIKFGQKWTKTYLWFCTISTYKTNCTWKTATPCRTVAGEDSFKDPSCSTFHPPLHVLVTSAIWQYLNI